MRKRDRFKKLIRLALILLVILFWALAITIVLQSFAKVSAEQVLNSDEVRYIQLWEHNQKYQDDFGCLTNPPYWGIIKKWAKKHGALFTVKEYNSMLKRVNKC